jgi:hypothetical protein
MTHTCPRCKRPGIGNFAKRWSSRAGPAECTVCGGLSHVLASTGGGIWAAGVVILVVSLIGALGLHSALLFASGVVLAVALNIRAWKRAKMYPISVESASSAGKVHWAIVGVYAFFALFQ